jgi:Predicted nucleic-acid-binding protein containing a Zn-ribbon
MAITRAEFPLPDVDDPLTGELFAGAARGELVIPRCEECERFIWYPAAECAECGSSRVRWVPVSGDATLFSWAVVRRAFLPAFAEMVPFVTALVALVEDPAVRLCTYIVDVEAESLTADIALHVTFRTLSFPTVPDRTVMVPMFAPSNGGGR